MDISVKILSSTNNPLKACYLAARNCYYRGNLEDLIYSEFEMIKLLKSVYKRGHTSIFEFANYQLYITGVSRSLLAQITRHRVGVSFAVQSQHYQKHDDFSFKELEQYSDICTKERYDKLMSDINDFYKDAINSKIPRYIAREVLPNSCNVNIVVNFNLRSLDHFFKLRMNNTNTPEIIKLAEIIYDEINVYTPGFNDIFIKESYR